MLFILTYLKQNPTFEVNPALRSRARVFVLEALTDDQIGVIVDRALSDTERGLGELNVLLAADARGYLINMSNGDARTALNALEAAALAKPPGVGGKRLITVEDIRDALQSRAVRYDKRAIRKPDLWYHDSDHAVLIRSNLVCHDVHVDPIQRIMRPI